MGKNPELDQATKKIAERMMSMPPKRHEDMKIGKTKPKRAKSPATRKVVEKARHTGEKAP
jgi:hypothetical protein